MSLPGSETDLVGNLVKAAAADLNIPIGTVIGTAANATSKNITVPNPIQATNVLLVQTNATGTVTVTVDTAAVGATPSFVSARKQQVAFSDSSLYALVINTDATNSVVAVKIANTSGASVTVQQLAMACLVTWNNNKQDTILKHGLDITLGAQNPSGSGVGTFNLTS